VNLLVIPSLLPKLFLYSFWKIWKEILWDLWLLFSTAFGYLIMYKVLGILVIDFYMIIKLLLTAVIPLTFLIVFNQNRLLQLHLKTAKDLNGQLEKGKTHEKLVHFDSDYQKDKLSIKPNLMLLIRAADNYIEVFWKDNEEIKSQMIRSSLVKAQQLFQDYSFIFKCHRSFIVTVNFQFLNIETISILAVK
jgi:hypothetical protein